jgi:hypothetical protein
VKVARWFIALFVVSQLLIPLQYYCCRADKNDERFAWRMFSTTRMLKCRADFRIDGKKVRLKKTFHEAWSKVLARGRMVVVRHMAQKLCDDNPGSDVRVAMSCKAATGERTKPAVGSWNFCEVGEL